jgi:hypothetical protein
MSVFILASSHELRLGKFAPPMIVPLAGGHSPEQLLRSGVANRADNRSLARQHGIIFRDGLIMPYLDAANVDLETKRVLDVALEMTRKSLGLEDDFANGMIAKQLIEIAKTGERNPDLLCEGALKKLRESLYGD